MKVCPTHGPLPLSDFYRDCTGKTPGGLMVSCKTCHKDRVTKAQRLRRELGPEFGPQRIRSGVWRPEQPKVEPIPLVRKAIENGFCTWEAIEKETRLTQDEIGETLVVLLLEKREVVSREFPNGERGFYLVKAA